MQTRFPFQTVAAEQFVPRTHHWSLPAEQCVALRQMGCACGGDPPLVLLGAWAVLAGRLLDATEITIGMRPSPPDGSGPGSGSNAHWPEPRPFHIRWQQNEIFLDFLKRLAGQIAADRKESAPDSNGSVAFSDGLPLAIQFEANTPWLALNREDAEGRSTKTIELFLIKLCCCSQAHSVDFTLHYNSAAMRLGDVERLAEQFYTLIESVLNQPQTPVGRLNLLSAAERRQILLQFNDTARPLPRDQIVLDWIAEQVERRPEAPAVVCGPARLSYGEMNARANALAKQLRAAGVSAGTPVALFLDRSPEMIVAILGALNSGGAYVPIDPAYPKERIEFLLRDSEAPVVVTTRSIWKPMANPAVIIYLDDSNTASLAPENAGAPMPAPAARSFSGKALVSNSKAQNENEAATDAQQLAYIIYTSGSTGSPKGVMVTHRNLLASTFARRVFYREPVRSYLLLSSYAFDSSVAGIFWTLSQGGKLVLPEATLDPAELAELIECEQVSHLLSLPSFVGHLADQPAEKLASLEVIIVAGESCPFELVRKIKRALPSARLFNEYGPTEATVWTTVMDCSCELAGPNVPIGKPIPNARVYLLDDQLKPVPIWATGEICIGGPGVTRGYWRQSAMTETKFPPDGFSQNPEARLYRTGDLGRYLPDGTIEFLGRLDHQVKIRGYRIELEEIENRLRSHPNVAECAVVVRELTPGDKQLVAYVTGQIPMPGALSTELKDFLRRTLPEYMIPSAFVVLKEFPRSANGKLDRNALPSPAQAEPPADLVAPRNATEETIAACWREVLRRDQIGVHDDFFELGGHSLLAIQVISRARELLGLDLPLRILFERPTVAGMAAEVGRMRLLDHHRAPDIISKIPRRDPQEQALDLNQLSDEQVESLLKQVLAEDASER